MPKIPVLSGREVCRILEKNGFLEIRRKGSHIVMQRKTVDGTITIPIPDHKELRVGTLQAIIRQSSLSKTDWFVV